VTINFVICFYFFTGVGMGGATIVIGGDSVVPPILLSAGNRGLLFFPLRIH